MRIPAARAMLTVTEGREHAADLGGEASLPSLLGKEPRLCEIVMEAWAT
jgi:hypothetical protein